MQIITCSTVMIAWAALALTCSETPVGCYVNGEPSWNGEGLNIERDDPRACPYSVMYPNEELSYSFRVIAPTSQYTGAETRLDLYNRLGGFIGAPLGSAIQDYRFTPPNATAYHLGLFWAATTDPIRDSAVVESEIPTDGVFQGVRTKGWAVMTGAVVSYTDLVGPINVTAGLGSNWQGTSSPTMNPPTSFQYQWRINGQNQSGATSSSYSNGLAIPGTYNLGVIMTYADGSADTNNVTVTSVFRVSILGPNTLQEGNSGTWTASVPGRVPPYTYSWTLDGSYGGNGSSAIGGGLWPAGTSYTVGLTVHDANGHVASDSKDVYVLSNGCPTCP